MRPGHYRPLKRELTETNITFKEVKRVYSDSGTSCYALRCLNLQGIVADAKRPEVVSQIEWVVALKLGRPAFDKEGRST